MIVRTVMYAKPSFYFLTSVFIPLFCLFSF